MHCRFFQNHVGDERPSLQQEKKNLLDSGQMCVTLWNENGKATWYLGYCVDVIQSGLYEHIHRVNKDSSLKWKYPTRDDIAQVNEYQILDCDIGDWNILNRNNEFTLRNHSIIHKKFTDVKHL